MKIVIDEATARSVVDALNEAIEARELQENNRAVVRLIILEYVEVRDRLIGALRTTRRAKP